MMRVRYDNGEKGAEKRGASRHEGIIDGIRGWLTERSSCSCGQGRRR